MYLLVEILIYKGMRNTLPENGYRPDIIVDGIEDSYWGVTFFDFAISDFDITDIAKMRFTFHEKHYNEISIGQNFKIMEGPHQSGEGKILSIEVC